MINTSADYRRAVEKNRQFRLQDEIFLKNKKTVTLSLEDVTAYSINEAASTNGKFEIGAAIIKEYKASINNMEGKFDGIDFEGAVISTKIGLLLENGSYEYLRKGEFRIVEARERDLTIDIKAYDGMLFFDRPYSESKLTYPATINQILSDACTCCQMTFNARSVQMGSYVVEKRPDDEAITFRDIISYCAQIMGCYAIINNLGHLEFRWYDFAALNALRSDWYDGGIFDKSTPYATGDTADGGGFNPWDTGTVIDGGTFTEQENYHHVYLLKSQSINTNDIVISGISITVKQESDNQEKVFLYGEEGYVLDLSENPLIQEGSVQAVLQHVGQKITGNTFRPLNITAQSDPCIEAGDLVIVTDRKQRSYWTVITNTTFSLSGSQKIECSAETPTEKNYTRYGAVTKLMSGSKDHADQLVKQQLSAYEIASRQFSSLMARSMGLYETYETQGDGSVIKYQHDKPNLSDSKTIWKKTQDAFAVSTDGGKTWNAGTDAEGNALFNVLSVIGLNADWVIVGEMAANFIKGGLLSIGREELAITMDGRYLKFLKNNEEYGHITTYDAKGSSFNDAPGINVSSDYGCVYFRVNSSSRGQAKVTYTVAKILSYQAYKDRYGDSGRYYPVILGVNRTPVLVEGSLYVDGTKSRIAKTKNYGNRLLYCYEMASPIFGDIGEGETDENGECIIPLDDIFSETVTAKIEYQVFLQKEGAGDLWVDQKNEVYFVVKGTPNLKFAWEIKALQKDYEYNRMDCPDAEYYEPKPDYEQEYEEEINSLIKKQEELLNETT